MPSILLLISIIAAHLSFAQIVDQSLCNVTESDPVIVTCDFPIKEFKCDGEEGAALCNGTIVNINNPIKDFFIKAEDDNIAMGTTFNVLFDTNITSIEGVLAGGDESLMGSTVEITNNQDELLCIKKLELGGDFSGDNFTLILVDGQGSGGIKLEEVVCGDSGEACTVKGSGPGDTLVGAVPSCKIITVSETGVKEEFDCLEFYLNDTLPMIRTANAPDPLPSLKSLSKQYILQSSSEDSSNKYLFGHSVRSLIVVLVLLSVVMIYAIYNQCYIKGNKKSLLKLKELAVDEEMQTLINVNDETEKYTEI